jgi:hypothetical protein
MKVGTKLFPFNLNVFYYYYDVQSPRILKLRWSKSVHRIIQMVICYVRRSTRSKPRSSEGPMRNTFDYYYENMLLACHTQNRGRPRPVVYLLLLNYYINQQTQPY